MVLSSTDLQILRILQKDASLTNKEIAFKIKKSVATIHERIRRLREKGYIKEIVAILDKNMINHSLIAFSQVTLVDHADATLLGFTKEVAKFPEVMECFQMTGAYDFLLRIVAKDMNAYSHFYNTKLAKIPYITTVHSSFVLTENKSVTAYPI